MCKGKGLQTKENNLMDKKGIMTALLEWNWNLTVGFTFSKENWDNVLFVKEKLTKCAHFNIPLIKT